VKAIIYDAPGSDPKPEQVAGYVLRELNAQATTITSEFGDLYTQEGAALGQCAAEAFSILVQVLAEKGVITANDVADIIEGPDFEAGEGGQPNTTARFVDIPDK
jgi:hypothetical protein